MSHLRAEHPDWEEPQVIAEAARRMSHGASLSCFGTGAYDQWAARGP